MPVEDLPAAGACSHKHIVLHVDGAETPPHAFDKDGHHFSHQDYQYRKQLCLVRPDHHKGEEPRNAGKTMKIKSEGSHDDNMRDELVKWQYYNHRRTSKPTMTCLIQPGHIEDAEPIGEAYWDVIREDRKSDTPHWSQRQFDMKKDHHTARIHKTEKGRAEVNNVSTNAAHYLHPGEMKKTKIFGESGLAHGHNSYAHFCVARRRHQQPVNNNEHNHRCIHPPGPSHRSHFFVSPEPQFTSSYLFPEGPSVTAKHVPKHFVDNVDYAQPERSSNPYFERICDARHSLVKKYSDSQKYVCEDGYINEPRIADLIVRDAATTGAVSEYARNIDAPHHRHRVAPCSPDMPRPDEGGMRQRRARSSDYWHCHTPGRAPHPGRIQDDHIPSKAYLKDGATAYRSHSQLMYDKHLCRTDMRHPSGRWERMEQGSAGHSAGGSEFSSLAGGAGEPHERRPKRSRSVEQTQNRRSLEQTQNRRTGPCSARAASSARSAPRSERPRSAAVSQRNHIF